MYTGIYIYIYNTCIHTCERMYLSSSQPTLPYPTCVGTLYMQVVVNIHSPQTASENSKTCLKLCGSLKLVYIYIYAQQGPRRPVSQHRRGFFLVPARVVASSWSLGCSAGEGLLFLRVDGCWLGKYNLRYSCHTFALQDLGASWQRLS